MKGLGIEGGSLRKCELKRGPTSLNMDRMIESNDTKRFAPGSACGYAGLALLAICWPLNWTLPGLRTAYLFFPLWLGYILVVDELVLRRIGSSLWTRSRRDFVLLFAASAPVWWIFEVINNRTGNWQYLGSNTFTRFEYYLLCTVCFSTVMPAVFETAELVRSFGRVARLGPGPRLRPASRLKLFLFLGGLLTLALALTWPKYCYPFVWTSLLLILEPLNCWLGRPHLLQYLERGDWRPIISLSAGAVICGFFWEMWNFYSWPKWIYHTPGAQFLHVFEMPLLGYGGYIPFGLELYALMNFLHGPRLRL
jgi:hypothetical protein